MRIRFEKNSKETKETNEDIPPENIPRSIKKDIRILRSGEELPSFEQEPTPPTPPPQHREKTSPVDSEINYFKENYGSVFGMDSLIPSSKEIIELNLLFAIYSELANLRAELREKVIYQYK